MEEKIRLAVFGQKRLSREGGIEIVVKELCTRMAQNGCDVTCYNRAGHHVSGAEYDKTIEYDGIRQKVVPTIEKKGLAAVSSSFFAALCSAFGRYDVVHIHAEGPAFFCWIPKLFGKRVICTIHGLDWAREKWKFGVGSKFIRQGEKNAVKYADEIIVLSKGVQKYFMETYGRETHFIPNGVNRPEVREAKLITDHFGLEKDSYIYDVRFDAIAPTSEGSTAQKDVIRLIINVEAQTAFNPGYPLTKRAIYYCSRMISAQHGPIFTNSEYGKIRKVYSIWVCTHPTKEFQNTLIRYSIRPEQLIGNAVEKSENYDLMSVVTICLGEPGTENYTGIVKFMDVLLSSSRAATEKKKILEEEFGVAMNEELEREVLVMCNLSQGVKAEGREEGINIGEMRMLVKQVRKGRVTIEEAAEDAGMTVEEFKKVMENTPLQAV